VSMSPSTFARLFKASVGATAHSFVLSRRLQRAEILLNGDTSLSEIALAVGFASQSHFTEAFRRRTGRTPSRVRRQADPTP
jgi:AraC family transcriptional regulator